MGQAKERDEGETFEEWEGFWGAAPNHTPQSPMRALKAGEGD